jgi:hypothetical protein
MSTFPMRYAGWMTRDVALGPGIAMLAVIVFAIFLQPSINGQPLSVAPVAKLLVLLVTARIVSRDFGGYRRVLFSAPVSPVGYYALRWLIGAGAGALAMLAIDYGVAVRYGPPAIGPIALVRFAMMYLLIGGLVFALSTVTRRDWIVAVLLMLAHAAAGAVKDAPFGLSPLWRVVYAVLPPFHLVGLDRAMSGAALAHVVLYGVALMSAGVAVLRWRPLGAGSRQ